MLTRTDFWYLDKRERNSLISKDQNQRKELNFIAFFQAWQGISGFSLGVES